MIVSTNAETALNKLHHPFMTKNSKKSGNGGNTPHYNKAINEKPTGN